MYQTQEVKKEDLSKIEVKNQEKIIELTGKKLDPTKAYEVIQKASKNFTIEHEKAKKADQLLAELLQKNGIKTSSPSTSKKQTKKEGEKTTPNRKGKLAKIIELQNTFKAMQARLEKIKTLKVA